MTMSDVSTTAVATSDEPFSSAGEPATHQLAPGMFGHLDEPGPHHAFSERFLVRGWALSQSGGGQINVVVRVDGTEVERVPADSVRADVGAAFATIDQSHRAGFSAQVEHARLNPTDQYRVEVEAIGPEGSASLADFVVTWIPPASVHHARGDYRVVWDSVATNLGDARVSVCGSPDDDEWERTGQVSAATIAQVTSMTVNDRVLEIGCGAGRVGLHLAPACREWVGADVSANMLDFARQSLADSGVLNVAFQQLHGSDLRAFADATFDVVYCTAVFMHLDEWDRFRYVTEMFRVLKPGGHVYYDNMSLVGEEGWALFLELANYDPVRRPPNISKTSTPTELRWYGERAGFVDLDVSLGPLWITVTAVKPR